MQKNSTSTIIRRSAVVVAFLALTHLFARLVWEWQAFGLNTPRQSDIFRLTIDERVYYTYDVELQPTSFWEYTTDSWSILGSHFIGGVFTFILFAIFFWVAFGFPDDDDDDYDLVTCTDPNCACTFHKADVFRDGEWWEADCTNANCKCPSHKNDEFDTGQQRWVTA